MQNQLRDPRRASGRREAVDKQASDHPAAARKIFSSVIQKIADEGLVRHHGSSSPIPLFVSRPKLVCLSRSSVSRIAILLLGPSVLWSITADLGLRTLQWSGPICEQSFSQQDRTHSPMRGSKGAAAPLLNIWSCAVGAPLTDA
ncbi:MAG: hypothetical protein OXC63_13570 [Aestuariivita sp.]|nr:hypothetical protein [Aestuariivita sp.]